MLSPDAASRLCSHLARQNENLAPMLSDVVAAMRSAFPGITTCVRLQTAEQRFGALSAVAYIAKNLPNFDGVQADVQRLGERAFARGFDAAAARQALTWAIVSAVQRNAGSDWCDELQRDWRAFAEQFCAVLANGADHARRRAVASESSRQHLAA
jgi:hypothetical protein